MESTAKRFRTIKGLKRSSDGPRVTTIKTIVQKFETYATICDLPRSGRPPISQDDCDLVEKLLSEILENGDLPTSRNVSLASNVPKSTVWKIMRIHLKLFPWKVSVCQKLETGHYERRKLFCENFLKQFNGWD